MREIVETNQFKRDYKKVASSGRHSIDHFLTVIELLVNDALLPAKYRDHALMGEWHDCRECHIKPDWLLIYQKQKDKLVLLRTGSHSDLF